MKHIGYSRVNGTYQEAKNQLAKVNDWPMEAVEMYINDAFVKWNIRSRSKWKIEFAEGEGDRIGRMLDRAQVAADKSVEDLLKPSPSNRETQIKTWVDKRKMKPAVGFKDTTKDFNFGELLLEIEEKQLQSQDKRKINSIKIKAPKKQIHRKLIFDD